MNGPRSHVVGLFQKMTWVNSDAICFVCVWCLMFFSLFLFNCVLFNVFCLFFLFCFLFVCFVFCFDLFWFELFCFVCFGLAWFCFFFFFVSSTSLLPKHKVPFLSSLFLPPPRHPRVTHAPQLPEPAGFEIA